MTSFGIDIFRTFNMLRAAAVTSQKILVVRKKMLDKKDDMYYAQNA
jgi:hypothetical protein